MAKKTKAREYRFLECASCGALNYRTQVKVLGGAPKLVLKKYCPRERTHTQHKLLRK